MTSGGGNTDSPSPCHSDLARGLVERPARPRPASGIQLDQACHHILSRSLRPVGHVRVIASVTNRDQVGLARVRWRWPQ